MGSKIVEHNELIAVRVPKGDRWRLKADGPEGKVHSSLTDALESYLHSTNFRGAYRLDPVDNKLYAITTVEEEVVKEEPKMYGLYNELNFQQGK